MLNQCELSASGDWQLEASLYGPLNALLHAYFPVKSEFMIKPQGVFRKKNEDPYDFGASRTSMGGEGYGGIQYIPDFIIVKGAEKTSTDKVIGIIEVKKHGEEEPSSIIQLQNYLISALRGSHKSNLDGVDEILGILVTGKETRVMKLSKDKKGLIERKDNSIKDEDREKVEMVRFDDKDKIPTGGEVFLQMLSHLAIKSGRHIIRSDVNKETATKSSSHPSAPSTNRRGDVTQRDRVTPTAAHVDTHAPPIGRTTSTNTEIRTSKAPTSESTRSTKDPVSTSGSQHVKQEKQDNKIKRGKPQ